MEFQSGRRNLIAVLDWGIGHASRSLALAQQLEANGESVAFAAAGNALKMLSKERPELPLYELPAYAIHYRSKNMLWNMAGQLPKIMRTIHREKKSIDRLLAQDKFDRLISDSRFGGYSSKLPSVMLTHQLHPLFGLPLVGWLYRRYLNHCFAEFWVPDHPGPENLSGKLSESNGYRNVQYIGPLSRLKPTSETSKQAYTIVALLSGPEPQRSYLEKALLETLTTIPGHHLLIAGKPENGSAPPEKRNDRISSVAYTNGEATASYVQNADIVLCRSGYSTLMDLEKLSVKKIMLVPTPGQTEQQYLAERMAASGRAKWLAQCDIERLPGCVQLMMAQAETEL